jgi:hypothetical protein
MNTIVEKVVAKGRLIVGELINLLTNLLVPAVDVVLAVAAVIPFMPKQVFVILHKVEAALEAAGTTLQDVEQELKRR